MQARPIGVQGPREKARTNRQQPRRPQPSPSSPTAAATQELNLVGNFPQACELGRRQKELAQLKADKWFPSTLDFSSRWAGKGSVTVTNTWDFCLQIVKAPKKNQPA